MFYNVHVSFFHKGKQINVESAVGIMAQRGRGGDLHITVTNILSQRVWKIEKTPVPCRVSPFTFEHIHVI